MASRRVRKSFSSTVNGPTWVSKGRRRERSLKSICARSTSTWSMPNTHARSSFFGGAFPSSERRESRMSWELSRPSRLRIPRRWNFTRRSSSSRASFFRSGQSFAFT